MPATAYDAMLRRCRERPSEHQMMIYSVKPYNQRLTTLNTHQQLAPVQRRHYRYAQEGFGEAATAKDVNFLARTPYCARHVLNPYWLDVSTCKDLLGALHAYTCCALMLYAFRIGS